MVNYKLILFFLGFFVFLSCDDNGSNLTERQVQLNLLNKNKDVWEAQNIDHYKLDQSKVCYCYFGDVGNNWSIEIKNAPDQFMMFNNDLVDELPEFALSVDQLFNQIEREINRDPFPYKLEVRYNEDYGYPEMFSVDIDKNIADEEYSFINTNFKTLECESGSLTGKLVLKGICMNYVIEVVRGDVDPELIEETWINPSTNDSYNNVFALGSLCDFPESIEEGDVFQFDIVTDNSPQSCAVCQAYSPVPEKSLRIKVCQ
ncbi:DUF6174 domain-containing protein [Lutimonas saemankumensis]|uniref:DUF6174 domain-containing protein n=1 Tax=Lutimonas saemankumensis TaxID=483016 RepID=UPI001CD75592|nr:DUF6174 domain-containing protein [Lutimonas saemankumensis]MCA0930857.1 DUF6174 domain-containing protein [Lutimonas saemankumensis]